MLKYWMFVESAFLQLMRLKSNFHCILCKYNNLNDALYSQKLPHKEREREQALAMT